MENWNKPYSKRAYDKIQANVDKINFNNDNTIIKVKVYWNLHKLMWSIRSASTNLVIAYRQSLFLTKCKFVVYEKGQLRVRESGHKNVHAFVCGEWDQKEYRTFKDMRLWRRVHYNPKRDNFFMVQSKSDPSQYEEVKRDFTYSVSLETENGKPITRI